MVMVRDSPQTQTLVTNHAGCLPLLVRSQPWLRTKSHSTFFGSGSAAVRARQNASPLVLGEGGKKSENTLADGSRKVQPLPIERLEHRAPSGYPFDDPNAVQHRACCAIPLGEHQHIPWPECLDCSFKFGAPDALSAKLLLLKKALAASSPEESQLAVKILMDSRHPRVTDQHLDNSPDVTVKLGTEIRYTEVTEISSDELLYRMS